MSKVKLLTLLPKRRRQTNTATYTAHRRFKRGCPGPDEQQKRQAWPDASRLSVGETLQTQAWPPVNRCCPWRCPRKVGAGFLQEGNRLPLFMVNQVGLCRSR